MVWYSYLFENFPQSAVIHTVKGFSIVNEAEVDIFLEFPYSFYDPVVVRNSISCSSTFYKSSLVHQPQASIVLDYHNVEI